MKRLLSMAVCVCLILGMCTFLPQKAEASDSYMSAEDARNFIAFVYNSNTDKVTYEALADDLFYNLLVGTYANESAKEIAITAAFLSFMETRIIETITEAGGAVKSSHDYLLDFFKDELNSEYTSMVTDIFKNNILKSVYSMCDGEEVLTLAEGITDASELPSKYLEDVAAISNALLYTYGQNVLSLYTYFDAAMSCVYLKSTPGAYETAMSYNIMALRESNFMSFATKLIPGITSWEEWIEDMDYWAEYACGLRTRLKSGVADENYVVEFHPNCEGMNSVKVTCGAGDVLIAPVMERDGYTFKGWYLDPACTQGPITSDFLLSGDIVLYAKWEIRYYNIYFDSNCSEIEDYIHRIDKLNPVWYQPKMDRPGYIFDGWYLNAACTNKVSGEITVSGDMTLYAGWISQYSYKLQNGKAQIDGLRAWKVNESGNNIYDLEFPMSIDGYPVESVKFFHSKHEVTGITFSDSIERVAESSFVWYENLKYVIFGDGIKNIETGAFVMCTALERVEFNDSLVTVGNRAFSGCTSLKEVNLPNSVISIGDDAFSECALEEFTIPDSVVTVGNSLFYGCENLKTVKIGKSLKDIPTQCFFNCAPLEEIIVSADNPYYTSADGVLYNKDMTVLLKYPAGKTDATFVIPDTVTAISSYAFYGAVNLEYVVMGKNVTDIGEYVFYECKNLKSTTLPNGLLSIPDSLFEGCKSLEAITLPTGLESIGSYAFARCESIQEMIIPDSVTYIGDRAFYACTALEDINIPSGIHRIEAWFVNCNGFTSIDIPEWITSIGWNAFSYCENLTEINIPDSVTSISPYAFSYCTSLEKFTLPNGVKQIDEDLFSGCTKLKTVVIPKGVTHIRGAFANCNSLTDIQFYGTAEEWEQIWKSPFIGDAFLNAEVTFVSPPAPAAPDFKEVVFADGKVTAEIDVAFSDEDMTVLVGLYSGDTLVKLAKVNVKSGDTSAEAQFEEVGEGKYTVKAFFWDNGSLAPKCDAAEAEVTA